MLVLNERKYLKVINQQVKLIIKKIGKIQNLFKC